MTPEQQRQADEALNKYHLASCDSRFASVCGDSQRCSCGLDALIHALSRRLADVARLEQERDEALMIVEGPSTLRDLANECGRARMNEQALEQENARLKAAMLGHAGVCRRIAARMEARGAYAGWLVLMAERLESNQPPQVIRALTGEGEQDK